MKDLKAGIAKFILPNLLNLLLKTLKVNLTDYPAGNENSVYIFWHSKMLLGWWLFKDKKYSALVSKSKDGGILTSVLNKWGYTVKRGSSSKGGKDALEELITQANNNSIVLTPDGPRGPAFEIKNGALIISGKCDIPIVPVKIIYRKKKILSKSWDKFEIPLPFSTCDVIFGNRHNYTHYLEGDELLNFKKRLSNEM